jgi:hypothetical protein
MANFLDRVVEDAKEIGVETLPKVEIDKMLEEIKWRYSES